ncbi:MAG: type I-E CRISPR-associated protein Cse1/CasA [Bifidobacteriaceae bacterium]|jgi:CRISPR system Cascade subunit CasA|nr:type I-E CRISPR-associated protein Cse1/CasA [Bifidobacteriaceae bacterium]
MSESEDPIRYRLDQLPAVAVRWRPGAAGPPAVSLRDALVRAHEIAGLTAEPLGLVSLTTRVLTPLVIDVFGLPVDLDAWAERWEAGAFDAEAVDRYFAEHGGRFDLFSPTCPFDQVAGLRTVNDETKPSAVLDPCLPTGNNVPLWSARTEANPPALTPVEAFTALEMAHAFDTAAIKSGAVGDPNVRGGKTTGNPVGTLGAIGLVMPSGRTLFETLLLNVPTFASLADAWSGREDMPHWRRSPATAEWAAHATAAGILELYTWQSRRVRLIPERDAAGAITVRRAVLTAGDRLDQIPPWDPRTQFRDRERPAAGQSLRMPMRHYPGRTGWRGLSSLLATQIQTADPRRTMTARMLVQLGEAFDFGILESGYPLDVVTVGVEYGNQSAVVESVIAENMPLPVRVLAADDNLRRAVLDAAEQGEKVRDALNRLEGNIREAAGGARLPWEKGDHSGDQVVALLGQEMRWLLVSLRSRANELHEIQRAWERSAWDIASRRGEELLAAAEPSSFVRMRGTGGAYNVAVAAGWFYGALRKALPLANESKEQDRNGESDE